MIESLAKLLEILKVFSKYLLHALVFILLIDQCLIVDETNPRGR